MQLKIHWNIVFEELGKGLVRELKLAAPKHTDELRKSIKAKASDKALEIYMIDYAIFVEMGCFLGNSHRYKILTKRGYKSLRDVKIGDLVLNKDEKWKKVIDKPIYKVGKISRYTIETNSGNKVTVTEEHPFWCKRNGKFKWIKAKNLKETDIIMEVS